MKQYGWCHLPIGWVRIVEQEGWILEIYTVDKVEENIQNVKCTPAIQETIRQLTEYFEGKRQEFDLPLAPAGTPFQKKVWAALQTIPYGETRTYGQIACQIGNPKACRAVGMANHRNPLLIVVPCHRVVGADGTLTGYAAGLERKQMLLELESKGKQENSIR
ncbi:MAG: methylated-DNA--[protein]-cysteine S-methyltransferase [Massiliimalia sp.]